MPCSRSLFSFCAFALIACASFSAYAASPTIQLKNVVEIETQVANQNGQKELKRLPAKNVPPEGEVIYTTTFKNIGNAKVGNVVITNPVPQDTLYLANSAIGSNTDITYSLNGRNFDIPENLEIKGAHGKGRPAIASDYASIRWVYKGELEPGKSGEVAFRVKVR